LVGNECGRLPLFDSSVSGFGLPTPMCGASNLTANPGSCRAPAGRDFAQIHPSIAVVVEKDEAGTFKERPKMSFAGARYAVYSRGGKGLSNSTARASRSPRAGAAIIYLERGPRAGAKRPPDPRLKVRAGPAASGAVVTDLLCMTRDAAEDAMAFDNEVRRRDVLYRGNGGIEVLPDTAFDTAKFKDRNVIRTKRRHEHRVVEAWRLPGDIREEGPRWR
jgi:hypothetical protein